jgi:hypothetical protein
VIEYHGVLGDLANYCQILSIPLALWLGLRAIKKKPIPAAATRMICTNRVSLNGSRPSQKKSNL